MKRLVGVSALWALFLLPTIRISAQDANSVKRVLPKDIDPDSGNRLPLIKREDLDDLGKKAYDAAVGNFAGAGQAMGAEIRLHGTPGIAPQYESPLGLPLMQLAILITAREHDQPYEWSLHEMQALAVGLDPAVIDVVRNRKPLVKLGESEAVIIQLGREIFKTHRLSSESYARALRILQKTNLVDAVGLMADYSRTSAILTAFNQQMPPGWKQLLPLPFTPPNDIHPDSRSRLPLMKGQVPAAGATSLYGRTLSPTGTGPGQLRLHGSGLQALRASVGHKMVDLAILISAREHDAQYDWTVNEIKAVEDGLEPDIIDVIRNRKPAMGMTEQSAILIEFGRELFGKHYVNPGTYSRALKVFGERDLVDLVDAMGQHSMEAALLAAVDQHLPAGQKPLLPMP